MEIESIIVIAQYLFFILIIYGLISKRVFLRGRWFYRSGGRVYWFVLAFYLYALGMFVYFFGWKTF